MRRFELWQGETFDKLLYKVLYLKDRFDLRDVAAAEEEAVFPVPPVGAYEGVGDAEGLVLEAADAV